MPKKKQHTKATDYEQLGKMLASIYESGYIDKNQMYKTSFIKGLVTGFGGVIGATLVVGLLLWILTFFDNVPLLGPLTQRVQDTVESNKP